MVQRIFKKISPYLHYSMVKKSYQENVINDLINKDHSENKGIFIL